MHRFPKTTRLICITTHDIQHEYFVMMLVQRGKNTMGQHDLLVHLDRRFARLFLPYTDLIDGLRKRAWPEFAAELLVHVIRVLAR